MMTTNSLYQTYDPERSFRNVYKLEHRVLEILILLDLTIAQNECCNCQINWGCHF